MDLLVRDEKALSIKAFEHKNLKALLDGTRWRIARELARHSDYPTNIAKKLELNEQIVHYHIRQLQNAGLIKITKTENIRGATARYFELAAPAFALVAGKEWRTFRSSKKPHILLRDFIENKRLNCKIIVGSPDSHGPQRQRARDLYHGIDLALLLGSYCTEINSATYLDTEINDRDLKDNLICVGGPISNLVTERFTRNTAIRFKGREIISKLSKKAYTEASNGLIMKIKNPLVPEKYVLILAGKSSPGTKAAILTLIKYPNMDYGNTNNKKHTAKVVEGIDLDGDGIMDDVEVKE